MSVMKELDFCITEMCFGDDEKRLKMVEEIGEHLNGIRPFHELSFESQRALEVWETSGEQELSYDQGTMGYPADDDDLPIQEDY